MKYFLPNRSIQKGKIFTNIVISMNILPSVITMEWKNTHLLRSRLGVSDLHVIQLGSPALSPFHRMSGHKRRCIYLTFSQSLHTSVLLPLVTVGLSVVNRKFCLWNESKMCERGKWNAHKVTQSSFQLMNTMKRLVVRISRKNLPNIDRNQKKSIMKFIILRPPSTSPVGCI